ncbi:MAG: PocR ligand-binding domain-containing protein [Lachnospiraceae bacterium]|nr:PocR ligand-binding domain-containing protein [Lachnospiraceae bacterium]
MLRNIDNYKFEDLFDMVEIQQLTDLISKALNVGVVIVSPEGKWITKPSSMCRFCEEIVKKTEKGYKSCIESDELMGRPHPEGPYIRECLTAGLMEAGISIFIKGRHIASWIIGQVRIEETDGNKQNIERAKKLDIDPQVFCKAREEIPVMTRERFEDVVNMINKMVVWLSELGYMIYLQKEELRVNKEREREYEEERKNLTYVAYHDNLTGLGNRAYFEQKLNEFKLANINPVTYIMCDVNNLKVANDIFGHDEGDRLLRAATKALMDESKPSYVIARCGGDEINVLIPNAEDGEGQQYIERVQAACARARDCVIPVRLAMGASVINWEKSGYHEFMIQADDCMYNDKKRIKKNQNLLEDIMQMLLEKGVLDKGCNEEMINMVEAFCRYLNLNERMIKRIVLATKYQDVGMIAISNSESVRDTGSDGLARHTIIGYELAKLYEETQTAAKIILQTHECYSGVGYPNKILGENILYEARIIYLVTSYVVWKWNRSATTAVDKEVAGRIKRCAGHQFDPVLVDKFLDFLGFGEADI